MPPKRAIRASSPTWCEVSEVEPKQWRARLGGFFGPTWMANLCGGVAAQGLSIIDAHAMRAHDLSWMAELKLLAVSDNCDPSAVPYLSLAAASPPYLLSSLTLTSFELVQTMDHGGTLRLTIEADDVLGLLGTLLTRFSELSLVPLEMHIETRDGLAHDCFWLSAVNGNTPSTTLRTQLEELLLLAKA